MFPFRNFVSMGFENQADSSIEQKMWDFDTLLFPQPPSISR